MTWYACSYCGTYLLWLPDGESPNLAGSEIRQRHVPHCSMRFKKLLEKRRGEGLTAGEQSEFNRLLQIVSDIGIPRSGWSL